MSDSSAQLHEDESKLTSKTIDMHRGIVSLMEELEAIDWYQQRIDATSDEHLKEILVHNRDEEAEHAAMTLEWVRRQYPKLNEMLKLYLFTEGSILEVEKRAEGH